SKELVVDLAAARGFQVDQDEYNEAMSRQREQSKATSILKAGDRENLEIYQRVSPEPTPFLGYDYSMLDTTGRVLGIIQGKEIVDVAGKGQDVEVILDQTPFYPEGGGQVGDKGTLHWEGGLMEVRDTRRPVWGVIVHRGVITEIERIVNEQVRADYPVEPAEMPYQAALAEGAMALFGEKYGSVVRMVRIPGYESKELCGGTHVMKTGQIGAFFITYEGSIGS